MRLFIGIEFASNVLDALFSLQNELRKLVSCGRYPLRENLHLTLQFLGETPESKVRDIVQALNAVAGRHQPFRLSFDPQLGYFGKTNPVRVIWLGINSELPALLQLQTSISSEMNRLGFMSEERKYTPHVTLARDGKFINSGSLMKDGSIDYIFDAFPVNRIERFALFSSSVEQGKQVYRILNTFFLHKE